MSTAETPRRGLSMVGLIFLACLVPFVVAWLLYYFWPPQARMNYGSLIGTRPLPAARLARPDGSPFQFSDLRGQWILLQIDSSGCAEGCLRKLYQMRQVRLSQGRNLGRIERVWLVHDTGPVSETALRNFEGTHVARAGAAAISAFPAEGDPSDHIYLADPMGSLMLRFPKDADPSRMKKDLERMLKLSWRPSG